MAQEREVSPEEAIRLIARQYGVNEELAVEVARKESNLTHVTDKVGPAGEIGIFQLTPPAIAQMKVQNPRDLLQNIQGGVGYLKRLSDMYDGDVSKTLMAYNGGEGNVARGSVSPAAQAYAQEISGRLMQHAQPAKTPATTPTPAPLQAGTGGKPGWGPFSPMPPLRDWANATAERIIPSNRPAGELPESQQPVDTGGGILDALWKFGPGFPESVANAIVRGYTDAPPIVADIVRNAFSQPEATGKGLAAGALETLGSLTPTDVLTSGTVGRVLKLARGAGFGTRAAETGTRAAKAAPRAALPIIGPTEAIDGLPGTLIRRKGPGPVMTKGAPIASPRTMQAQLEEIAAQLRKPQETQSFAPPTVDAPWPPLSSYDAARGGAVIPEPGGAIGAAEESGRKAVRYMTERERYLADEAKREAQKAQNAATIAANERRNAEEMLSEVARRKMRAANQRHDESILAVQGTGNPTKDAAFAKAAGYRRAEAGVVDPNDPALRRPPTGTVATPEGYFARDPAAQTAESINPDVNPPVERPQVTRRRTSAPPGSPKAAFTPPTVDPATLAAREAESPIAALKRKHESAATGGAGLPEPTVTSYGPLDSGTGMTSEATASAGPKPIDVSAKLAKAWEEGKLQGILTPEEAQTLNVDVVNRYLEERRAAQAAAAAAPAPRTPAAPAITTGGLNMSAMAPEELAQRFASTNPEIASAAEAQLNRVSEANKAAAPAAAEGFTNTPRVTRVAPKAAPAQAAVTPPEPPVAARPPAPAPAPEPVPAKAEATPAPAPEPAPAPAEPTPYELQQQRREAARAAAETPPVTRVPMGATGGGPIGKPRTEPNASRTRNAGDIAPGKTVRETKAAEVASDTATIAPKDHKEVYQAMVEGKMKSALVDLSHLPPAKVPTQYRNFNDRGWAVEKHPNWGSGEKKFLVGKTQGDLNALKEKSIAEGKWPGENTTPAEYSPNPAVRAPKPSPERAAEAERIAAEIEKSPGDAPTIMIDARAKQVEDAVKEVRAAKPSDPVEGAQMLAEKLNPVKPAPVPPEAVKSAVEESITWDKAASEKLAAELKAQPRSALEESVRAKRTAPPPESDLAKWARQIIAEDEGIRAARIERGKARAAAREPGAKAAAREPERTKIPSVDIRHPAAKVDKSATHWWDEDNNEWVPHSKPEAPAKPVKNTAMRDAWLREIGPAPKGTDLDTWKTINAIEKTTKSQMAKGVQDIRLIKAMHDYWGAEEAARRIGWGGEAGANKLRNLLGLTKGSKIPLHELARQAESRYNRLINDPRGFMRTEALLAGAGAAGGAAYGATLDAGTPEDRAVNAFVMALAGGTAGLVGGKMLKGGKKALKANIREAPNALNTLDTVNILSGTSIVKATGGSIGGVVTGVLTRLAEGDIRAAQRGLRSLSFNAPKAYFKTLFAGSKDIEQKMSRYYAHGRAPKSGLGKLAEKVAANGPLRLMSAADDAGVTALKAMGYTEQEAARFMLVGHPVSWQGQAMLNAISSHIMLRFLVKFPRAGISMLERSIEWTPGLNHLWDIRSTAADAMKGGMVPHRFVEAGKLSKRSKNAMGAVGGAAIAGGVAMGYNKPDLTPVQMGLLSSVGGPVGPLANAGMIAGKAWKKGGPGLSLGLQQLTSSLPKVDEQAVRMMFTGKRFIPGASASRLLEAINKKKGSNPYSIR